MRAIVLSILMIFMAFSIGAAAGPECCDNWDFDHGSIKFDHDWCDYHYYHDDKISLEIDDGDVVITCDRRRYKSDKVRITGDYRLYVNGDRVDLNDDQRELVEDFYHKAVELNEEAEIIAREGARIGVEGAKIGARAITGVLRMFFLDFDEDEFEERIEGKAEDLEEMASKLEERAEDLEDMADELEEMHDEMADEIRELRDLRWF